ncbi:hypothetical protein [Pelomonas sp. KK5]|uniref:hypothetical protein n=1 Tax=Pelomonas sp. KK5 TaxID=1855730 RepID=UPI00117D8648|nr:hypothetical protein [Pelomonas sp. KK5]
MKLPPSPFFAGELADGADLGRRLGLVLQRLKHPRRQGRQPRLEGRLLRIRLGRAGFLLLLLLRLALGDLLRLQRLAVVVDVVRILAAHPHLPALLGLLQQRGAQLLGQAGGLGLQHEGVAVLLPDAFAHRPLDAAALAQPLLQQLAPRRRDGPPRQQGHHLLAADAHQRAHHLALADHAQQRDHLGGEQRGGILVVLRSFRLGRGGLGLRGLGLGELALLVDSLVHVVQVAAQFLDRLVGLAQQVGLLVDLGQHRQPGRGILGAVQHAQRPQERRILQVAALGEFFPFAVAETPLRHGVPPLVVSDAQA